jgi:glutamine amidotransferase
MGWNTVEATGDDPLLQGLAPDARFYFVHSFAAPVTAATAATATHGARFAAVVRHRNFTGVQFHPERSGAAGARLLRNFLTAR